MGLIALLSDFGLVDGYVAQMKGAIAAIAPQAQVIDITHLVPPQDIAAGRFCLMSTCPYFPVGTVHVAVVDPGVGGARRAVAVRCEEAFFVAPDNGLLSGILAVTPAMAAVELTECRYWRTPSPSATFHGRDIFAPVGAHLSSGVPFEQLGCPIDAASLVVLDLPDCRATAEGYAGAIQAVDRFGNLITNFPGEVVVGRQWRVVLGNWTIPGGHTYSDVPRGEMLALVGSHGFVEVAVAGGCARQVLAQTVGDPVILIGQPSVDRH
ncbi:SAM hydrolase/SAM-dependent halogenase family protein [Gloeobacter morelensis]|uniref:SAM-dependent chlorinase/fluorinase n=1 Tax=Gloeobacter morelensis MG652769 TaxID=2781736 RepID=A0ABY3PKD7_9CYAN|nr:SAM-dependent chlorinase/fluorinase [Gloeobacter morelensis]UFP94116.1 SAM-dependent chlorinase/fluorinase [Gloeobacter morelensis MG652769]